MSLNDRSLMWKNLWRKPVRTMLLLVSIMVGFAILATTVSFNLASTQFNTLPTRMVTLSKINFTESLPIAHYDRISHMDGVRVATHMNWFGGYYREQQNFLTVFATDPRTYFAVYSEDLQIPEAQREAFFNDRTAMLVAAPIAEHWGWRVGQRIPIRSNIFTNKTTGNDTWEFTLAGTIPTPQGSSQTGAVLIHYDYFNETRSFGRDRIGWIPFLTTSAAVNNQVTHAIDQRFANSQDETSTQDEATFGASFAAQRGNITLVISLIVGAAFTAILLIVGTTMALAVRERTKEIGVMKTLGFPSGRVVRMVLGESLLLALIGAALGVALSAGLLKMLSWQSEGAGFVIGLSPLAVLGASVVALLLGLITGALPAISAYRMNIIEALGRR
jgi:putative ABC transport system permease protein